MKYIIHDSRLIEKYKGEMGGVFTLSDLKNLFGVEQDNRFYRRIQYLENAGVLSKYIRGFYTTPDFRLEVLSQKICNKSYISFETILAKKLIIGTVPRKEIKAVKIGKKSIYEAQGFRVIHLSINENLFFGMETVKGIKYAFPEKAFIDTLYFYLKGHKYFFDIYSDINIRLLNLNLIYKYLKQYKNKRFISFVRNYLNEDNVS